MNDKTPSEIAHLWFEAFNAHHLDNLLSLYDDQAKHFSPKLKLRYPETIGFIHGKNQLRVWWKDAFERLPSLRYIPTKFIANDDAVFMEYIREVEGEEPMTVGEILEIKKDLIVYSRVYHS